MPNRNDGGRPPYTVFDDQPELCMQDEDRIFMARARHCPIHGSCPVLRKVHHKGTRALYRVECTGERCLLTQTDFINDRKSALRAWNVAVVLAK